MEDNLHKRVKSLDFSRTAEKDRIANSGLSDHGQKTLIGHHITRIVSNARKAGFKAGQLAAKDKMSSQNSKDYLIMSKNLSHLNN